MIKNIPYSKFSIIHNQCSGFKIENFYLLIKINLKNNHVQKIFELRLNCHFVHSQASHYIGINRGVPYYLIFIFS